MSREDPQLRSRIPEHLKESLEQKAKENKRTLTAEIVSRLEETVEQDFVIRNSNGFKEIVKNYNDLCEKYEELKAKDKREGVLLDREELRSAVNRLHELLNPPVK
ncbi:Arc family DNA-binding protein [Xenorhabdus sp. XENO-1]|uniref:Arc family DNA-binding protein n=1 Tax=Xenorhabdus bovienii TaxID=40576 RepID=UPI0020CA9024|nr:Arc family DNA-binding protein [Xenorhabdus bovienii]MCP9269517.1 Arc family DNA-binding protein [Xenorhabdus bovienii subsp. africana]